MKLNKEQLQKIILGSIVGIIILVVLVTVIFGPNIRRMRELRGQINKEGNKVIKAEQEVSGLAKLKLNLKRQEEEIKWYQLDMPLATPDWLLERLNSLAGETGIDFDKIEPKGYITKAGSYWLQGLYIEVKTDYHRLGIFINKLENLSPFIKILDLSITGNKDDIKRHIVKLTVGTYVSEKK